MELVFIREIMFDYIIRFNICIRNVWKEYKVSVFMQKDKQDGTAYMCVYVFAGVH